MHWILLFPAIYLDSFDKIPKGPVIISVLIWHLDFSWFLAVVTWLPSHFFSKYFHVSSSNELFFLIFDRFNVSVLLDWQNGLRIFEIARFNRKFYCHSFFPPTSLCFPGIYKKIKLNQFRTPSSIFLKTVLPLSFLLTKIFSISSAPSNPLTICGIITWLAVKLRKMCSTRCTYGCHSLQLCELNIKKTKRHFHSNEFCIL